MKGKTLAAAKDAIAKAHCATGTIRRAYSSNVKAGLVISQHPAAGSRLKKGSSVNLVISRGRKPR